MATIPTPSPVTPGASETQAPINHIGRMAGALFSPKATFEDSPAARAGSRRLFF